MLNVPAAIMTDMQRRAEEHFPNECCGVLLGTVEGEQRTVAAIVPIANSFDAAEKYHRFLITPQQYQEADKEARRAHLDILGFYHSHPNAPSVASKYDLEHAFPWFSYLILSIMNGKYHDVHSWIMKDDRSAFREENIISTQR